MIKKTAEIHADSLPLTPLLADRWSPRAFNPARTLSRGEVLALVEAARWAPSANNLQPWRYRVVRREEPVFAELTTRGLTGFNQAWAPNASALIVLSVTTHKEDGTELDKAGTHFDAGLSAAQLVLQAAALGLHAHYMAGIVRDQVAEVLGIDGSEHVVVIIAVGEQADETVLAEGAARERELAARTRHPLDVIAPRV